MSALAPLKTWHADVMHRLRWRRVAARRITRRFVRAHGLVVQTGPFAGMRYPRFAVDRAELLVPKLLGCYEEELHPAIESVVSRGFERVVDIGASDGYYAVGLARALPKCTVLAYEMNAFPSRVCSRFAAENGVADRVRLLGECTTDELRALPEGEPTFVLSDCEGAEAELMNPAHVPVLRGSSLVVELHDHAAPGIESTIAERFGSTHTMAVVESRRRFVADYPALMQVPDVNYMDRELGASEFRPVLIKWAILEPR